MKSRCKKRKCSIYEVKRRKVFTSSEMDMRSEAVALIISSSSLDFAAARFCAAWLWECCTYIMQVCGVGWWELVIAVRIIMYMLALTIRRIAHILFFVFSSLEA